MVYEFDDVVNEYYYLDPNSISIESCNELVRQSAYLSGKFIIITLPIIIILASLILWSDYKLKKHQISWVTDGKIRDISIKLILILSFAILTQFILWI